MKSVIVFAVYLALAAATPQFNKVTRKAAPRLYNSLPASPVVGLSRVNREAPAVSVKSQVDQINPDGSYKYALELDDGTALQESGKLLNPTPEGGELVSTGSFSYTSPEGQAIKVTYVADGQGFKPQGNHLPVAPPIPEGIQKALAFIAAQG